jgi:hypothetical protein
MEHKAGSEIDQEPVPDMRCNHGCSVFSGSASEDGPAANKKTLPATERDTARIRLARRRFRKHIDTYPVKKLKFIDESGIHIAMTRHYGRAPRGQRVHDAVPKSFGRNISILGALSWYGMNAVMTVEGAVDTAVFRAYVKHVLVPTLHTGDVVVMDNPSRTGATWFYSGTSAIGRLFTGRIMIEGRSVRKARNNRRSRSGRQRARNVQRFC